MQSPLSSRYHRHLHLYRKRLHRPDPHPRPQRQGSHRTRQFRVYAGTAELGAAWQKTSEQGRDYLSVKLDDPSFPAPIYATLAEVEGEDGLQLSWSRSNRD